MFTISQSNTYFWPVEVEIPTSGGKFEKQPFDVEFKRIPQARIRELRADLDRDDAEEKALALLREVVVGWRGVDETPHVKLEFSQSALDKLLDVPLVAAAILRAFLSSLSGAPRKN